MNIAERILARGKDLESAILTRDGVVTYGELRGRVARVAGGLLAQSCMKGDRVGIFSQNSPFFVSAYLGIIRAGLIAVPFQTDMSANTFSEIVSSTGLKGVLVSDRFLERVRPWAEELGLAVWLEQESEAPCGIAEAAFPAIAAERDLAALMFTSGSTGSPKGVKVTHRNIECNTLDIISYMELNSSDRAMIVLPLHYCFGLSLLHSHLMAGGSVVLNNEFKLYPEAMLAELGAKKCTGLAGVPSTYQILLRRSRFRGMEFPHLRWLQQAGGRLPEPCIREIVDAFQQARFFLMYGQTEGTARLSYLPPQRLADKLGSIGTGLPSTRLEVLKADGITVAPGSDELGEIVATGDNITLGYWNDPVETAKYFKNGKLHTGDLARVDKEGFIFVEERARDLIKSGGNRIGAREVEDVIAELQQVVEVAVVAAPDDLLGEAITAFLVVSRAAQLTPGQVEAHCRKRLPAYKVPSELIFLEAMPHSDSGKILKQELRKLLRHRQQNESTDNRHLEVAHLKA